MTELPRALALSFAQLGDPRIVRVLIKTIGVTLLVLGVSGFAAWHGMRWLIATYLADWLGYSTIGFASIVTLAATIIGAWLLFRLVALAVMQFFADEVVRAVEARHYPHAAARMRDLPWREEAGQALRGFARALLANALAAPIALALLFTAIGPAIVFGLVNAWLLGRELQDMVWLRHPARASGVRPVAAPARFALGGVVALLLLVPVFGLVAPIIGAAAATHLVHRGAARLPT